MQTSVQVLEVLVLITFLLASISKSNKQDAIVHPPPLRTTKEKDSKASKEDDECSFLLHEK